MKQLLVRFVSQWGLFRSKTDSQNLVIGISSFDGLPPPVTTSMSFTGSSAIGIDGGRFLVKLQTSIAG
ncbi:hypothetical protein L1987_29323 [Smallanthus sonchifolius]|uniref:Uncharacterized protein n=1 Tax=Smallanthus sonchifolius TaxID=185202 RepID=A0ACB9HZ63_9ASTR|nr:hypothetical protein L1987_29323 [Smallanthus sonchifolius]